MAIQSVFNAKAYYIKTTDNLPTWEVVSGSDAYIGWQCTSAADTVYIKSAVSRSAFPQYCSAIGKEFVLPVDGASVDLYARYIDIGNICMGGGGTDPVLEVMYEYATSAASSTRTSFMIKVNIRPGRGLFTVFKGDVKIRLSDYQCSSGNAYGRYLNNPNMKDRYAKFANADKLSACKLLYEASPVRVVKGMNLTVDTQTTNNLFNYPWFNVYGPQTAVEATLDSTKVDQLIASDKMQQVPRIANGAVHTKATLTNSTAVGIMQRLSRSKSQDQVMGISATSLAYELGCAPEEVDGAICSFEWLHLVAHRFGVQSSLERVGDTQSPDNLVLGTTSANTQMLMLENAIASFLNSPETSARIDVAVIGIPSTAAAAAGRKMHCLTREIHYEYTLLHRGTAVHSAKVIFNALSSYCPCVHEAQMVNLLYKKAHEIPAAPPVIKALMTRASAAANNLRTESLSIMGLQINNPVKCSIVGNRLIPESSNNGKRLFAKGFMDNDMSGTNNTENVPKDGTAIIGELSILDMNGISAEIALLNNGESFAAMDIGSNFTFDQIFNGFNCDNLDLFVLKNASVALANNILTLSGKLDMSREPLSLIGMLLPSDFEVYIRGDLKVSGMDISKKIEPEHFTLTTVAELSIPITDAITLKSAKLSILVEPKLDMVRMERSWNIRPLLQGVLEVDGISKDTLRLECSIGYNSGTLALNALCGKAEDFCGVSGLVLEYIKLQLELGGNNAVSLAGAFNIGLKSVSLGGVINKSAIGLYGSVENFTLYELDDVYYGLTGQYLSLPDYDILFDKVMLGVASNDCSIFGYGLQKGLTLTCNVTVHGFSCGATINISTSGVMLEGFLNNAAIGSVDIEEAKLRIALYSKASGKTCEFTISGKAKISNMTLSCRVSCLKVNESWAFLLAAALEADVFSLSSVLPPVKDTFLDSIRFSEIGFIYSTGNTSIEGKKVREGLSLAGRINEIDALSAMGCSGPFDFNVHLGKETDFALSMPSSQINLGSRVKCDPFTVKIAILPAPSFALVFGMDLDVDGQSDPLHFDFILDIGIIEAKGSATMHNWWVNPFGISENLKIGPAVALELGINYAQFMSTGLPSTFGIAGGFQIGDVNMQMAVKISENPSEEILMGSVSKLSVSDLVSFASAITTLSLSAGDIPDFFTIEDFLLYVAPSGGSIGTIIYERGVSFSAKLILFGKTAQLYARFSEEGIAASGSLDRLELGPLKIGGRNQNNLSFDLELSSKDQHFMFDGEISIFGAYIGAYVVLSKKMILFDFEMSFLDLLTFEITGKSVGSLTDLQNLDFQLSAVMNNSILDYLKNEVAGKIRLAIETVNKSIDEAKAEVEKAKTAYHRIYEPALKAFDQAKAEADRYLDACVRDLQKERSNYEKCINNAESEVVKARNAFNNAINKAQRDVEEAKNQYEREIDKAKAEVQRAQNVYNSAMDKASRELKHAEDDYNSAFNYAKRQLDSAQRDVDSLMRQIKEDEHTLKNLSWYEYIYKGSYYSVRLAGLYTAYGTATAALQAAKAFLNGIQYGTKYTVWIAAKGAFDAVKTGVEYTAFESSKATLEYVIKNGAGFVAFESAKMALETVKTGAEYTAWQTSMTALEIARKTGLSAIAAAQFLVDNVARSAAYIALDAAKLSLEATRNTTEFFVFESAKAALEAARIGSTAMLKLAEYIATYAGEILNIRRIALSASLKGIESGQLFKAEIDMVVLSKEYNLTIDFNVNSIGAFIENLFKEALQESIKLLGLA